jgi:hypothetical protein
MRFSRLHKVVYIGNITRPKGRYSMNVGQALRVMDLSF